ncbi:MAG: hypothetical protein DLM69_08375 [Candidatus Chloroheliales bacterium]|nr:MAG: hypothetical protein DLM69_08375 [Chloroflexota bacterium]
MIAYVSDLPFSKTEELNFHKIEVSYTYLLEWLSLESFKINRNQDGSTYEELIYRWPEEEMVEVVEGVRISVVCTDNPQSSDYQDRDISSVRMRFEAEKGMTAHQWGRNYIEPVCDLLSLSISRPNSVHGITAYGQNGNEVKVLRWEGSYNDRRPNLIFTEPLLILSNHDVVKHYGSPAKAFSELMRLWLDMYIKKRYDLARALFFQTIYSKNLPVELAFLSLTLATESYHRERFDTDEDHQKEVEDKTNDFINEVESSNISPNSKKRIRGLIRAKKGESLNARISSLVGDVMKPIEGLASLYEGCLGQAVATTRGSLVHGGIKIGEDSWRRPDCLAQVLSYLMRVLILREIGLPLELITKLIKYNAGYRASVRVAEKFGKMICDEEAASKSKGKSEKAEAVQISKVAEAEIRSPLNGKELIALINRPGGKWVAVLKGYLTGLVRDGKLKQDDKDSARKLVLEIRDGLCVQDDGTTPSQQRKGGDGCRHMMGYVFKMMALCLIYQKSSRFFVKRQPLPGVRYTPNWRYNV